MEVQITGNGSGANELRLQIPLSEVYGSQEISVCIENWQANAENVKIKVNTLFHELKEGKAVDLKETTQELEEEQERYTNLSKNIQEIKDKIAHGRCGVRQGKKVKWVLTGSSLFSWLCTIVTPIIQAVGDTNKEDNVWKGLTVGFGIGSVALTALTALAWRANQNANRKKEKLENLNKGEVENLRQLLTFFEEAKQLQEEGKEAESVSSQDLPLDENKIKKKLQECLKAAKQIPDSASKPSSQDVVVMMANLLPQNSSLRETLRKIHTQGLKRATILNGNKELKSSHKDSEFSFERGGEKTTLLDLEEEESPEMIEAWKELDAWTGDEEALNDVIISGLKVNRQGQANLVHHLI